MMKKVALFGYGKTTKALAKKIKDVVFFDDKCLKPFKDENGYLIRPSNEFEPNFFDIAIPSPGIAPSNALIDKATNLISEYDYFANTSPLKIWISGTNGKTTTTQMMQHLLQDRGSCSGGNIGTPLASLDDTSPLWILETSSFTIHYTKKAWPNIYVLLPLSPDHLSWHGSMEAYIQAKLKPLAFMKEGEIAIISKQYQDIQTNAHLIVYDGVEDLAQYFGIDITKIKFEGVFLLDALLAMAVDKILFDRVAYEKINSFIVEAHRQEEIRDKKNRLWVNDSKATNVDATMAAIKRYQNHFIHLILGGDDKGVSLDELFAFLQKYHLKIYAIGANKEKLVRLAKKYDISYQECFHLVDAVKKIDEVLQKDEVALLAPAAASLDEYSSYMARGDEFKENIQKIS